MSAETHPQADVWQIVSALPQDPIFVVGFPRSGTTLLQSLLFTQPGIVSYPENHFFHSILRYVTTNEEGYVRCDCLSDVLKQIVERVEVQFCEADIRSLYERCLRQALTPKLLFELIVAYRVQTQPIPHSYRWLDKTPTNIYHLPQIIEWYPGAQIVNIIRNPIAAIHSRRTKFTGYAQARGIQIGSVTKLANEWRRAVCSYEEFVASYPDRILSVRYEDLVANHINGLRYICDFLGIAFDELRIQMYRDKARQVTYGWETWKLGVQNESISNTNEVAVRNMPVREIIRIQSCVGDLMVKYGYDRPYSRYYEELFNLPLRLSGKVSRLPMPALIRNLLGTLRRWWLSV